MMTTIAFNQSKTSMMTNDVTEMKRNMDKLDVLTSKIVRNNKRSKWKSSRVNKCGYKRY